jgi:arsenite methyltransferase
MNMKPITPIHAAVREHYASLALSATPCCGPQSCDCNTLYPTDLTSDLPSEIAAFSLGCGDPISLAGLQPGEVVVDLGSGGGLDCFMAAKAVGETGRVIGVDMTPAMVDLARTNAIRLGAANVEFRQGYIEALPVADDEATVVISNCVINLSPDKPQVFREIFRVLRPGGRLAISDIVTNGPLPEAVRSSPAAWSACVAGAIDAQAFRTALETAGFVNVTVQPHAAFNAGLTDLPAHTPFSALITAQKPQ